MSQKNCNLYRGKKDSVSFWHCMLSCIRIYMYYYVSTWTIRGWRFTFSFIVWIFSLFIKVQFFGWRFIIRITIRTTTGFFTIGFRIIFLCFWVGISRFFDSDFFVRTFFRTTTIFFDGWSCGNNLMQFEVDIYFFTCLKIGLLFYRE